MQRQTVMNMYILNNSNVKKKYIAITFKHKPSYTLYQNIIILS